MGGCGGMVRGYRGMVHTKGLGRVVRDCGGIVCTMEWRGDMQ